MFGIIGASLAPIPVGHAIDVQGSAQSVLWLLAVIACIVGIVAILKLRTPDGVETPQGLE